MHGLSHFRSIAEGTLLFREYVGLLRDLHTYHATIGAAAKGIGASHLSSSIDRASLLEADIRHLGGHVPVSLPVWSLATVERMLGALYVAEGSMLGGRVLARQLDYLFPDGADGRSFFIGSSDDHINWQILLATIEGEYRDSLSLEAMIGGAHAGFELFENIVGTTN